MFTEFGDGVILLTEVNYGHVLNDLLMIPSCSLLTYIQVTDVLLMKLPFSQSMCQEITFLRAICLRCHLQPVLTN